MLRKPVQIDKGRYPEKLRSYLENAIIYDSSCSPEARVVFIDKDKGFYLKTAPKGSLKREAEMTKFFAGKGLSANVLEYISLDKDYMLTERVRGEDCTYYKYLDDPERLCDIMAESLLMLHGLDYTDCPVPDRMKEYFQTVDDNYKKGLFDLSYSGADGEGRSADEIYRYLCENKGLLKSDTLLHGDYCLPNIMLDDFRLSGFIDVGNGGVGDRHVDLFWGAWTLNFNLHTDKYRDRFFSAYGKEKIDVEKLRLIGFAECFG